ncbi:hypothetical protein PINS_up007857 [Pythium insidiosum]|nr:hypothetical protein PINS_up007857 [Pythium insidiosum]
MQERLNRLSDKAAEYPTGLTMPFSRQELARIKKRFLSMVPSDSAALSLSLRDVTAMPEFVGCSLIALALRAVVSRTSNAPSTPTLAVLSPRQEAHALERLRVSFEQFLALLSLFSVKQSLAVKRKALFDIYDADQDGVVSLSDVVKTLRTISPATSLLSVAQLRAVVSSTLGLNDSTASLDFSDFQQRFTDADVKAAMTLAF